MGFASTRKFIQRGVRTRPHRTLSRMPHTRWDMHKNTLDALIRFQRLELTVPKAKEVQKYAEEIIRLARKDTPESDKHVESMLRTPVARKKLYEVLVPRYENRPTYTTRIVIQHRYRMRDSANMCYLEYVDRPGELRPAAPVGNDRLQFIHEEMQKSRRNFRRYLNEAKKTNLVDKGGKTLLPFANQTSSKYVFSRDVINPQKDAHMRRIGLTDHVPALLKFKTRDPYSSKEIVISDDRAVDGFHVDVTPHKYWKAMDRRYAWWRKKTF